MFSVKKLLFFASLSTAAIAQPVKKGTVPEAPVFPKRPKLVVGIVVDQMRYDYLYRYYDRFSKGGFRRMMDQGFNCRNNHYHYAATYTGPGHTHIYTGSAPALSGIVGNDFYDRTAGRIMYCAEDTAVQTVGNTGSAGKMSPKNLLVTTICDQLKLATDGRAKVFGVALKDRGAILPAGHAANGAFWFDSKDGNWISSTYYMKELPKWVQEHNSKRLPDQYLSKKWEPLLPLNQYLESAEDDQPYEALMPGEQKSVFPHEFVTLSGGSKYEGLRTSPYGDALTKEFALAAIKGEELGKDAITDFLCVSFSSPDYIGHAFGTHAVETEDNYIRLDSQLADLFNQLDASVGKGEWVAFLSADHGVADIPGFLKTYHIPADVKTGGEISDAAKAALQEAYGPGQWVLSYVNQQVYLNHALLQEKKIAVNDACDVIKRALLKQRGVLNVVNLNNPGGQLMPSIQMEMLRNVYQPNRSGDVYIVFNAGWFEGRTRGTTHGTMYAYDTHVPLLFYGWGIKPGQTVRRTAIADIAPTVAALLGILEPSGTIGAPIEEVLK